MIKRFFKLKEELANYNNKYYCQDLNIQIDINKIDSLFLLYLSSQVLWKEEQYSLEAIDLKVLRKAVNIYQESNVRDNKKIIIIGDDALEVFKEFEKTEGNLIIQKKEEKYIEFNLSIKETIGNLKIVKLGASDCLVVEMDNEFLHLYNKEFSNLLRYKNALSRYNVLESIGEINLSTFILADLVSNYDELQFHRLEKIIKSPLINDILKIYVKIFTNEMPDGNLSLNLGLILNNKLYLALAYFPYHFVCDLLDLEHPRIVSKGEIKNLITKNNLRIFENFYFLDRTDAYNFIYKQKEFLRYYQVNSKFESSSIIIQQEELERAIEKIKIIRDKNIGYMIIETSAEVNLQNLENCKSVYIDEGASFKIKKIGDVYFIPLYLEESSISEVSSYFDELDLQLILTINDYRIALASEVLASFPLTNSYFYVWSDLLEEVFDSFSLAYLIERISSESKECARFLLENHNSPFGRSLPGYLVELLGEDSLKTFIGDIINIFKTNKQEELVNFSFRDLSILQDSYYSGSGIVLQSRELLQLERLDLGGGIVEKKGYYELYVDLKTYYLEYNNCSFKDISVRKIKFNMESPRFISYSNFNWARNTGVFLEIRNKETIRKSIEQVFLKGFNLTPSEKFYKSKFYKSIVRDIVKSSTTFKKDLITKIMSLEVGKEVFREDRFPLYFDLEINELYKILTS